MTVTTDARALMRAAYENRYTWDSNFPGYTADVTLTMDGTVYTGSVRIGSDLKAEVSGVNDEAAKKAIAEQAWEIAIHRVRRDFETTHGKNEFSFGETDETGAVELLVHGATEGDRYKVRNNEVVLVHRHIHGTVVTINTFSTHDTGEGYLSHTYDAVYHDPTTGEQRGGLSQFEDHFTKVGDYFVLTQRTIKTQIGDKTHVNDFSFGNIAMLQPAAV
ncbi:MAG: DUF3386 domain-containing protein [Kaiparowitsia implicata GSE-PSE-MK54-09C]|jgi:hypothetical protein|nr:DUF3386 domain-containing protein [Kaiparowitsia implicata GSE-PSE-MK54-09C]